MRTTVPGGNSTGSAPTLVTLRQPPGRTKCRTSEADGTHDITIDCSSRARKARAARCSDNVEAGSAAVPALPPATGPDGDRVLEDDGGQVAHLVQPQLVALADVGRDGQRQEIRYERARGG